MIAANPRLRVQTQSIFEYSTGWLSESMTDHGMRHYLTCIRWHLGSKHLEVKVTQSTMMLLPWFVVLSWLVVFMLGYIVGRYCTRQAHHRESMNDNAKVKKESELKWNSSCPVYHLGEEDRVVHLNKNCEHLWDVRDVRRRLKQRRLCSTCAAQGVSQK